MTRLKKALEEKNKNRQDGINGGQTMKHLRNQIANQKKPQDPPQRHRNVLGQET